MHLAGWQFEIVRPWWLAALATLPVAVYYARRSLVRFGLPRRLASLTVRVLLLVAMIFALCGLKISRETSRQFVVLAVDESRSVTPEAAKIVRPFADAAAGQGRGDRVVVFALCGQARRRGDGACRRRGAMRPPGTDIAAALAAARAAMPAEYVPRIVLFSDGNATAGDALAAARAAGVPISTVPLPGPEHEVYVAAVTAPGRGQGMGALRRRRGDPIDARRLLHRRASPRIEIARPGGEIGRIHQGENHVRFPVTAAADGPTMTLTARVSGCQDTIAENNEAGCVVAVGQRPRVLLVESRPAPAARLAEALRREHVEVTGRLAAEDARAGGRPRSPTTTS